MTKKKKMTKKAIEEMNEALHKDNVDHKKRIYETYLKALIKYDIKSLAFGSVMYTDLYYADLLRDKPNTRKFMEAVFWHGETIEERRKEELKHYDTLIKITEGKIKNLTDEVKLKIAKDCIEMQHAWLILGTIKNDK